jgi:hypothetical protein
MAVTISPNQPRTLYTHICTAYPNERSVWPTSEFCATCGKPRTPWVPTPKSEHSVDPQWGPRKLPAGQSIEAFIAENNAYEPIAREINKIRIGRLLLTHEELARIL